MNLEPQLYEAIVSELRRQADISDGRLSVEVGDEAEERVVIHGPVDLGELIAVVTGAVAGGP